MGLDIIVYRISTTPLPKSRQIRYIKPHPDWVDKLKLLKEFEEFDWNEYKKLHDSFNIDEFRIYMQDKNGITGTYKGKDITILYNDIPIVKRKHQVIYVEECGYQRKGLNSQFYYDFETGKAGRYVWTLEELERYRDDYAKNKEDFQNNIIDKFMEGICYVEFNW